MITTTLEVNSGNVGGLRGLKDAKDREARVQGGVGDRLVVHGGSQMVGVALGSLEEKRF
jgi:hypothetical protein